LKKIPSACIFYHILFWKLPFHTWLTVNFDFMLHASSAFPSVHGSKSWFLSNKRIAEQTTHTHLLHPSHCHPSFGECSLNQQNTRKARLKFHCPKGAFLNRKEGKAKSFLLSRQSKVGERAAEIIFNQRVEKLSNGLSEKY